MDRFSRKRPPATDMCGISSLTSATLSSSFDLWMSILFLVQLSLSIPPCHNKRKRNFPRKPHGLSLGWFPHPILFTVLCLQFNIQTFLDPPTLPRIETRLHCPKSKYEAAVFIYLLVRVKSVFSGRIRGEWGRREGGGVIY